MRLTRVYVEYALALGQRLVLPKTAARHLLRVLRLGEGHACVLFNGDGHDYTARIVQANQGETEVEVVSVQAVHTESPLSIWLVQGIARGEKMDLILQKATELGVNGIVPVISERSEVRLDAARAQKRLVHWRNVIVSACEQSGRARIPVIAAPQTLVQCGAELPQTDARWWLDPDATDTLYSVKVPTATSMILAVGPEGGWSPRDRQLLTALEFMGLRLGPRILRTETAGLAAISVMQMRFGDFAGMSPTFEYEMSTMTVPKFS